MLIFSILLPTSRGAIAWCVPWLGRIPIVLPLPRFRSRESRVLSIPCSRRSGIDGCSEDVVLETVRQCALLVADHTWYESYHGIRYDGSSQFATCQHIVAHGDLSGDEVVAHTLVDTFVMSTQNDEIALHRHLVGYLLVEGLSVRRHVDDIIVVAFCLQAEMQRSIGSHCITMPALPPYG